jgi:hypothetical protein
MVGHLGCGRPSSIFKLVVLSTIQLAPSSWLWRLAVHQPPLIELTFYLFPKFLSCPSLPLPLFYIWELILFQVFKNLFWEIKHSNSLSFAFRH